MKILHRYIGREIARSVLYVLLFCVALQSFFDLMSELRSVGQGDYKLIHAFAYVGLDMAGYIYEFLPIAVLIGTILTLVQFAARSEFTIMRASSMSTNMIGWSLFKIGIGYVVITFLFGELISPVTSEMADHLRAEKLGGGSAQEFRSGQWTKDLIRDADGKIVGSRNINVRNVKNGQLKDIRVFEFDRDFHQTALTVAERAQYRGHNIWRLENVTETRFNNAVVDPDASSQDIASAVVSKHLDTKDLESEITPQILQVSTTDPDNMTIFRLAGYVQHLTENNESTALYDIAFWKKIFNPFANLIMMALALPFAYLHTRSGGTSLKTFIGIMIGVSFVLINRLFSYMGLLNTWPPMVIAIMPSLLYFMAAVFMLRWVERH
ncbi:MAG: LPS export ABC transporter permease LptG [Burkholderiaceae bacterium]|nr:LPS export ABC transporter permease LptG [Burkholderiaceae bacterium]